MSNSTRKIPEDFGRTLIVRRYTGDKLVSVEKSWPRRLPIVRVGDSLLTEKQPGIVTKVVTNWYPGKVTRIIWLGI